MSRKMKAEANMNRRTNKRSIAKNLVLWALIILTALSGIWLLVSPTLEKQAALDEQNRLISEIEANRATSDAVDAEGIAYDGGIEPDIFSHAVLDVSIAYIPNDMPESAVKPSVPLNSGLTAIGALDIDKIGLKLPVVCGITDEQLKIAVGLVPETVPIGETGNAVIAGHRSYTYGKYFNRLGEMAIGDIITYTPKDGETMTFEVFEVTEIEPGDQIAFIQPKDESIITLYTCTPVRKATHRLLVRAIKI